MTNNLFNSIIRNQVLPLSVLKKQNYALFKYYMNNKHVLKRRFQSNGVQVLNDLRTKNTYTNIKLYLRYRYGSVVDLNVLRAKDRTIYNYISKIGNVNTVVKEMGFQVEYTSNKRSMDFIMAELNRIVDEDGYIYKISDAKLYGKLQNNARKNNQTVKDYLLTLGFHYGLNIGRLLDLREQGLTYEEIGLRMNISHTTVSRTLKKVGD